MVGQLVGWLIGQLVGLVQPEGALEGISGDLKCGCTWGSCCTWLNTVLLKPTDSQPTAGSETMLQMHLLEFLRFCRECNIPEPK